MHPQEDSDPTHYEKLDFRHFYLQPKDDKFYEANLTNVKSYAEDDTQPWKISLQYHKLWGLR